MVMHDPIKWKFKWLEEQNYVPQAGLRPGEGGRLAMAPNFLTLRSANEDRNMLSTVEDTHASKFKKMYFHFTW